MNQYKIHRLTDGKKNNGVIKSNKNNKSPNNKNKKNNKIKKKSGKVLTAGRIVLLTFLSLIFMFFLAINIFLYVYKPPAVDIGGDFDFDLLGPPDENDIDIEAPAIQPMEAKDRNSDCYTFLILGMDGGSGFIGRTDTMMLAMFNVKENKISILNIPRDTYVGSNYSNNALMNGVYARGRTNAINKGIPRGDEASIEGIKYLCTIVKYTFGVPVNYYVLLDLKGFKVLVDRVGGVDFDVPIRMKYTDPYQNLYIDLQPGLQTLDGNKAEQLIRFRHNDDGTGYGRTINGEFYASEDIGRIQTQQRFIAALMKKMLNKPSVDTIKGLFEVATDYMLTNISLADAGSFAAKITNVKLENIRTHTVPGNWIGAVGRYEAYKAETMEIINKYYNPYKKDIPATNFNIYDKDLGYVAKPEIDIDGKTMNNLTN